MLVITGASKGIGRYLLEQYVKNEAVVGTYLSTIPPEVDLAGNFYMVDVSNYDSVQKFFDLIKSNLTDIVLVNCAGISYNSFLHKSDPKEWRNVIDTNLIGTYNMIRAFLPTMREQQFGRIINFSSVVAKKGTPGVSAYAASKSALWGMTKSLAEENGRKGVTINNINLGYVNLGMGVEQVPEEYQVEIKRQIPSGEFCSPQDIFNTIEYIRKTPYVNGSSIDLNGGLI